jgi:3-oxoacyl-[acyl-carrier protein] reductase
MVIEPEAISLITRASSSTGRATAAVLARRGDHVVLADPDESDLIDAVDEIGANERNIQTYAVDERDRLGLERMCEDVNERFGGITYAFISGSRERHGGESSERHGLVVDTTLDDWREMLDRQLIGAFHVCQTVIPNMVAKRRGAVVLDAADLAVVGAIGRATDSAAGAALYSLAKALAVELAPEGVRVNAVGPGRIASRVRVARADQQIPVPTHVVPIGRLGRAEEVAHVVAFLLSDRASYITGQLVEPAGGQVMW